MLTVGDRFPSFALTGVYGAEDEFLFEEITNANLRGLWSIIFGYPEDFTFVCPTELLGYNASLWREARRSTPCRPTSRIPTWGGDRVARTSVRSGTRGLPTWTTTCRADSGYWSEEGAFVRPTSWILS